MQERNFGSEKYADIIHLPHRDPTARHPRMTMLNRAAQFAPFAALKGYEEAIGETARFTDTRPEISDDAKELLNRKLGVLQAVIEHEPSVTVTYFRPDSRKSGGTCITVSGRAIRLDPQKRILHLRTHKDIPLDDLLDIVGEPFVWAE